MIKNELTIVTPDKTEKFFVEWIQVESPNGEFVVGKNPSDLISIIKDNSLIEIKISDQDSIYTLKSYRGFIKIESGKILIVLDR